MKNFLAVYLGSESGEASAKWDALDANTRSAREQTGMTAWMHWMEQNKASIVVGGSPVGSTKLVNAAGVSDTTNQIVGYVIIRAESHAAAAKLFENHPHFSIFPGDSIEVMECLPIPGM